MKKVIIVFALFFTVSIFAQSEVVTITQKKCIPKRGIHLRLKSVYNDSRCPEGVDCIWAGEVSVIIDVYKDKKLVEEKNITFNSNNREENIKWFENYYSKKIKGIGVMPYPKEGEKIKAKKRYIKVTFSD